MKTLSMVKGKALNYDEANQFVGGARQKEEEKTYNGGTLQEVVVTGEKKKIISF